MDNMQSVVMNVIFVAILVVIGLLVIRDALKKRRNYKTAQMEENNFPEMLSENLSGEYVILSNVRIMTKIGKSIIDDVIISPYGIFCGEFRRFYLYVHADTRKSIWQHSMGLKGHNFTSPLYQTKIHFSCISELIGEKDNLRYIPLVVFPSITSVKVENPEEDCFIGPVTEVIEFINRYQEPCLTEEEVNAIAEVLTLNSEKVATMSNPSPLPPAPEEYLAFVPGDRETQEDEDEEGTDSDDEKA